MIEGSSSSHIVTLHGAALLLDETLAIRLDVDDASYIGIRRNETLDVLFASIRMRVRSWHVGALVALELVGAT